MVSVRSHLTNIYYPPLMGKIWLGTADALYLTGTFGRFSWISVSLGNTSFVFLTAHRKQDHKRNGIVLSRNVGIENSFQSYNADLYYYDKPHIVLGS